MISTKIFEFLDEQQKIKYHQMIDYTKSGDNLSNDDLKKICREAESNNFYALSVLPQYISKVKSFLKGDMRIIGLIDFPKGTSSLDKKLKDIAEALTNGANEIDVVINYEFIKDEEDHEDLEDEIRGIAELCHKEGKVIKVIIEIGKLTFHEIEKICDMCIEGGVDYIMTSTGKLKSDDDFDEKIEKIEYMRKILPSDIKIKMSGGIRTYDQIDSAKTNVDRFGTSVIPN